jgi:nucleotide-binding universal stress UspA family protein
MNVLFAYDGSTSADAAIAAAANLLDREEIHGVVATIWEPLLVQALRTERFGAPVLALPLDATAGDEQMEAHARQVAEHGAALASEAGLAVRPLWISDRHDVAKAIVDAATELDVDLIVTGARGLTGVRSLIGSVSRRVVQDARQPILVVPTVKVGETDRAEQHARSAVTAE